MKKKTVKAKKRVSVENKNCYEDGSIDNALQFTIQNKVKHAGHCRYLT